LERSGSCRRSGERENTSHPLGRRVTVVAFNHPPTHVAREKERGREMQRKKKTEQKKQDEKIIKYSQAKNIRSFFFVWNLIGSHDVVALKS
jgi:hypothetical protein